jgi:hypothetical protein
VRPDGFDPLAKTLGLRMNAPVSGVQDAISCRAPIFVALHAKNSRAAKNPETSLLSVV